MTTEAYKTTVSYLMAHSHIFNMLPGDGIVCELELLQREVRPYLTANYPDSVHLKALATLFRSCQYYAAQRIDVESVELWYRLEAIYQRKNHDYGNAWEEELEVEGIACMRIRTFEKLNRCLTLLKNESQVNDEKIEDTLQDLCNYAVMTAYWIMNLKH